MKHEQMDSYSFKVGIKEINPLTIYYLSLFSFFFYGQGLFAKLSQYSPCRLQTGLELRDQPVFDTQEFVSVCVTTSGLQFILMVLLIGVFFKHPCELRNVYTLF